MNIEFDAYTYSCSCYCIIATRDTPEHKSQSRPRRIMGERQRLLNMEKNVRNVVILGKVGTGKKTLGNRIAGKDIFQTRTSGDVHYQERETGDTVYHILTVDTEGKQTGYVNPLPFIERYFDKIHLIIFVIAYGRYTDESHSSLIRVVNSLDQRAKSFSALVITHCEGITDEERQGIADDFKHDSRSSQVAAFIGKGIYTVGFPDNSKLSSHLKQVYQKEIDEYETTIRQLVMGCDRTLRVQNLGAPNLRQHGIQEHGMQDLRAIEPSCWETTRRFWNRHCPCECIIL